MNSQAMHLDPEFSTFTYGDPTSPKRGLRHLDRGDLLVFYCGLEGWEFKSRPALYWVGHFEIEVAGLASDFSSAELRRLFSDNFHVRHPSVFEKQKDTLVLARGTPRSRLFKKAHLLSSLSKNRAGQPLKVLSREMQKIFGGFDGKISFQRSPTRWVDSVYVEKAAAYIRSLE